MQSQETCPDAVQLLNAREKVFRPQWEFFSGRDPVASLSPFAQEKGGGILFFRFKFSSAPVQRNGDGAMDFVRVRPRSNPKRCRAALATALQIFAIALVPILSSSCFRSSNQESLSKTETREVTDEAGRRVKLPLHIDRIVSLAPNLTEIVYAVGAGDRLVGDTTYCDYPAAAKSVAKIGDTMHPSVERIIALKPQIVLVSTASQLEAFTKQLDQPRIAVYVTNPGSLDEIFHSITVL